MTLIRTELFVEKKKVAFLLVKNSDYKESLFSY